MRFSFGLLCCVLISLAGCADVASLAQTMNERQIAACLVFSGSYGPFVGIHGVAVTGGATFAECKDLAR
jgi:hypothetical protein